jgi:hypothetical protein
MNIICTNCGAPNNTNTCAYCGRTIDIESQNNSILKNKLIEIQNADEELLAKNYHAAYTDFSKLNKRYPKDEYIAYKLYISETFQHELNYHIDLEGESAPEKALKIAINKNDYSLINNILDELTSQSSFLNNWWKDYAIYCKCLCALLNNKPELAISYFKPLTDFIVKNNVIIKHDTFLSRFIFLFCRYVNIDNKNIYILLDLLFNLEKEYSNTKQLSYPTTKDWKLEDVSSFYKILYILSKVDTHDTSEYVNLHMNFESNRKKFFDYSYFSLNNFIPYLETISHDIEITNPVTINIITSKINSFIINDIKKEYEKNISFSYRYKQTTEQEIKNIYQKYHDSSNKKGKCFIATATMGSYDHPIVVDLREFRDDWLLTKDWGISFVNWYYKNGPHASRLIEKSTILKKITYYLIVLPLHLLTKLFFK